MWRARRVTVVGHLTVLASGESLPSYVIVPVSERSTHARVTDGKGAPWFIIQRLTVYLTGINIVAIENSWLENWPSLH